MGSTLFSNFQINEAFKKRTKKNEVEEPTRIFPPDVIMEILSWLPLKSLSQLQLVCKQWQALANDHYFIEKHMSRTSDVWHCSNIVTSIDDPAQFFYIHGCDGLLLLKNIPLANYILWNPATRRVLKLPDPHHGSYGLAISFVPATGSYRIVSFYNNGVYGEEGCEILTPGQNQAWRCLIIPHTVNVYQHRRKTRVSVISTGAAVHCVVFFTVGNEIVPEIISLDTETERFSVNHLPEGLFCNSGAVRELDWNGKLGFVELVGPTLKVMELEDYKKQRWCDKKKVIHLSFMEESDSKRGNLFPLFAKEGRIWFWLRDVEIFTYMVEDERKVDVTPTEAIYVNNKVDLYKPSLITFKNMQPDYMLEKLRIDIDFEFAPKKKYWFLSLIS